eukprot:403364187
MENQRQFITNSSNQHDLQHQLARASKKRHREFDGLSEYYQEQLPQLQQASFLANKRFCTYDLQEKMQRASLSSPAAQFKNSSHHGTSGSASSGHSAHNNTHPPSEFVLNHKQIGLFSSNLNSHFTQNHSSNSMMEDVQDHYLPVNSFASLKPLHIGNRNQPGFGGNHQNLFQQSQNGQNQESSEMMMDCQTNNQATSGTQSRDKQLEFKKEMMRKQLQMYKQQMIFWNGMPRSDCCDN